MQSYGFYSRLLGPISNHILINRISKDQTLQQEIWYSPGATAKMQIKVALFTKFLWLFLPTFFTERSLFLHVDIGV